LSDSTTFVEHVRLLGVDAAEEARSTLGGVTLCCDCDVCEIRTRFPVTTVGIIVRAAAIRSGPNRPFARLVAFKPIADVNTSIAGLEQPDDGFAALFG
jgi:hypothetical protein